MIIRSIVGLIAAIWVWNNVHWIAGLIVGFFFVGGAGWGLVGSAATAATPSGRKAFGPEGKQFTRAWEQRFGEMRPGRRDNLPPPGAFQSWLDEYRRTGIEAGDWIDERASRGAQVQRLATPPAGSVTGICQLQKLLLSEPDYPQMRLLANERGLAVHNMSGTEFFSVEWSSVGSVERADGQWWVKFRRTGIPIDSLIGSFFGLAVLSVDDPERFNTLVDGRTSAGSDVRAEPTVLISDEVSGQCQLEDSARPEHPQRAFTCNADGLTISNESSTATFVTIAWPHVRSVEKLQGKWWLRFRRGAQGADSRLDRYFGMRVVAVDDPRKFDDLLAVYASGPRP